MTTITEGALAFDFPEGWHAAKYDKWIFYLNHFQNVFGGAKGVDILAINPNRHLWLIEVKDYRARPRQKARQLVEEVAIKVRDSLAGLAAARLRATDSDEVKMANRALSCRDMKVVLHLEQPIKPTRLHPIEDVSKLIQKLKQLLRAIDFHPRVTNRSEGNQFGWEVREV
ncbi:MAG TPA: hypothetical protein DDY78_08015 [Planctomycetales bacterium]|nr:hypothetical protein [Planctomycetales bacterium]